MTKIVGTIKWFSSRKGFGFVAPKVSDGSTKDEVFVHHSALQMAEGGYRTVEEGAEIEFETETDEHGKVKAVNVTSVGGKLLQAPKREKRRSRKNKKDTDGGEKKENGNKNGTKNGNGKKEPAKKEPPFHDIIKDDVKEKITEKGIALVRNTVDISQGGLRIKLGQGGYASLVDAAGVVGEGSYTCDDTSKITFNWERCLEFKDKWHPGDVSKLVSSLSLTDDSVGPVEAGETPEALWGSDKPDPKDLFPSNGFKMKKVILTRPLKGKRSEKSE